jgi:assimilatory nitrate reductase catalytic subunit
MKPIAEQIGSFVRQWDGPQTADLVLHPGNFGLGKVPARLKPDDTTTTVCGFCSTGCGLNVHLKDGRAVNLSADTHYPVNLGMACPKGWEALTPLAAADRATSPLLRRERGGAFEAIEWEYALMLFCERFKEIKAKHGAESVAFLSSGQIVTEEMALLGVLFKFGMGFVHCDSNTRQCMATSATAYKQSFGFDAPPYTYADFEESDVLVFIGSNPCIAHPIMWQRVRRNRHNPEIIVLDPRSTETAMAATQHYALRPRSDLILLYGLANILTASKWIDRAFLDAHTTDFDDFAEFVTRFAPDTVSAATGISVERLWHLAQTIAEGERVSFWWTMGVNQGHEATRTAQAIINLALMTGNIGRPGTGANSITGQCNAMGSRIFANITNLLGGYDFLQPAHREHVAAQLGIDPARIPRQTSKTYDRILQDIGAGKIRGLWVIGTNPSHSWIHNHGFDESIKQLDFLVVQDMYHSTETAQRADLVLPAAGWGEKEGTLINSERRIGLVKKVARAPGAALSDFNICKLIAQYWGCGEMFREWSSPEAVFQILKRVSRGQPCDITGIANYRMLDECGGVQWPWTQLEQQKSNAGPIGPRSAQERTSNVERAARDDRRPQSRAALSDSRPAGEACVVAAQSTDGEVDGAQTPGRSPETERRLFADGRFFHDDGRAKFYFDEPRDLPEAPDAEFPLLLLTGRGTSSQWHTQTRTEKSDVLRQLYPAQAYVEINPVDAERLGIESGSTVCIASRRAEVTANAFVTPTVQPGQVFMPMHYVKTNALTLPAFDPHSRQPAYKACAISIRGV